MKTQYSILLLWLILLINIGCSSDDSPTNDDEPTMSNLIGHWKPIQEIIIDDQGFENITNYDDCIQQGRMTIENDNTFLNIGYYPLSGVCDVEYDNNGNWQVANNIIRITLNGQVDNGFIGDYFIVENTATRLRLDADTDPNSVQQYIYVFEKVN